MLKTENETLKSFNDRIWAFLNAKPDWFRLLINCEGCGCMVNLPIEGIVRAHCYCSGCKKNGRAYQEL